MVGTRRQCERRRRECDTSFQRNSRSTSASTVVLLLLFVFRLRRGAIGEKDEPDSSEGAFEGTRPESAGEQEGPYLETSGLGKDQPGLACHNLDAGGIRAYVQHLTLERLRPGILKLQPKSGLERFARPCQCDVMQGAYFFSVSGIHGFCLQEALSTRMKRSVASRAPFAPPS